LYRGKTALAAATTGRPACFDTKRLLCETERKHHPRRCPVAGSARVCGAIGYIWHDQVRTEFIYCAQFTQPAGGGGLAHTENIYRINIKIGLHKGIIKQLQNPDLE
jgi:hypothetical protein